MDSTLFPVLIPFVVTALDIWHDPRKLRIGVELLFCFFIVMTLLAGLFASSSVAEITVIDVPIAAWVLLAVMLALMLGVFAGSIALIINGITMVRAEGKAPSHLLSLVMGLAMMGYIGAGIICVFFQWMTPLVLLMALAFPMSWLGYGLIAFIVYSFLYRFFAYRFGRRVDAVIVLGAGVPDGEVRPLLASRIQQGIAWVGREDERGSRPILVMSGGQGADEPLPEARAMAHWAIAHGMDEERIVCEEKSTTTEENLLFSAVLLAHENRGKRVAVVTSDYHAFRAATLMRQLGIPGYSIGAPTARYYRPSAMLREYVALLRDHLKLNVAFLGFLTLPFAMMCALWLLNT